VGTTTIMLVDESREELYSGKSGAPRAFMVQIWYPAEPQQGAEPAPWLENMDVMGPAIAGHLNLPGFFLDHVKYARTHAVTNAPIAGSQVQYPVLLFSHGWGGFRTQNTYQMEELASHGYVIAAPDHTYGAIATVFPEGNVALNNPEALPLGMDLSDDELLAAVQLLGAQWAGDLSFILDTLENLTPNDPAGELANHLDFSRIGVLGHSTGGGAAIQFCATDSRCQAAIGMDPFMDPVSYDVQDQGLDQPYLAMFSEVWAEDESRNNTLFDYFSSHSESDLYRYTIQQTAHYDFTDMPAFSPLAPHLGLKGSLDGEQVSKIINAYTLAFFGHYFKGESAPLLEQPSPEFLEMIYQ
jgi:predicted dienelactone hydrolase